MKNLLNFLIEVGKLKKMPRRGWVINQIKNPESIAEHVFRAAILGWLLAQKKNLKTDRIVKIALVHDLCEIYAGDTTPYDSVLPKDKKKLRELMKTWPRFSNYERRIQALHKYKKEEKGFNKLIAILPLDLKKEIKNFWFDYEHGLTQEGRFFRQADRMENFLQALEYWKKLKNPPMGPWWLWAREFFDDPLLLKFINALDEKFHHKKLGRQEKDGQIREILNFLIEIGNLKRKGRRGWIIHKVNNAETSAEHIFHLAILTWILGKKRKLNLERAIKMALIHDICEVYSPDFTSYDAVSIKDKFTIRDASKLKPISGRPTTEQRKKMEKVKKILETRAMNKLISNLPGNLKRQIKDLWLDFENGSTKEGRFVKQADKVINLLQGLIYWKKYGRIEHRLWVRRAKEVIDDPVLIEFLKTVENKFCLTCKK
ncbi:MAG: HD domain-containing protein [Candidatus Pacebacteria bacterium]|nr:HD domain-containing protein [Candidatus Paceibacterota bacterium]